MRLTIYLKSGKRLRLSFDIDTKIQSEVDAMLGAIRDKKGGVFTLNHAGNRRTHIPLENIDYVVTD